MGIPYFLSAQLDGYQRDPKSDSGALEGWIGLIFFNIAAWVAIVLLDKQKISSFQRKSLFLCKKKIFMQF